MILNLKGYSILIFFGGFLMALFVSYLIYSFSPHFGPITIKVQINAFLLVACGLLFSYIGFTGINQIKK